MRSIQSKFALLIIVVLAVTAIAISTVSIVAVSRISSDDAKMLMTEICLEQTEELNSTLALVEQSVNTIYVYANDQLKSYDQLLEKDYTDAYLENVRKLAIDIANRTKGAMAVYFRLDAHITGNGKSGFFWSRRSEDGNFIAEEPTDLLAYDKADAEHVGWYYVPINKGEPLWMDPYFNKNLGVNMISYVIPYYMEDKLLGVIGMDIDFTGIITQVEDINLYDTGKSALISMANRKMYYSVVGQGIFEKLLSDVFYDELASDQISRVLYDYESDNVQYKLAYATLDNQMKLIVFAPLSEINANRNKLIRWCLFIMSIILICTLGVSFIFTEKLVRPLKALTAATEEYAKGNWQVEISCHTGDEIQKLTESILVMAHTTQRYISDIKWMAKQDGLTRLNNKMSFLEYQKEIKKNIDHKWDQYGLVIFDVNDLKKVNDAHGHEWGDQLIKCAGEYISSIFTQSVVFRYGGDEFAAILMGKDLKESVLLMEQFDLGLKGYLVDEERHIELTIASGLAIYPEDGQTYEEIFQVADERMYADKQSKKAARKQKKEVAAS